MPDRESFDTTRGTSIDIVQRALHYNKHPSGVECIEINEHMTANMAASFKYGWRYLDKGDPVENLKKMLWYLQRSLACDQDNPIFGHVRSVWFLERVLEPRIKAFARPSPWCEPVRMALEYSANIHCPTEAGGRLALYHYAIGCVETAIADEQCLGRQFT